MQIKWMFVAGSARTGTGGASESRPRPVALPVLLFAIALPLWTLLRLGLWIWVGPAELSPQQSATAFGIGLWFDLAALAFLLSPLLFFSAVFPDRWRASRFMRAFRWMFLTFATGALLFGVVAEITFWNEFTTRFNFIAVDYLIYTGEVIGNIRQSYPVGWILAGIAATAALLLYFISRRFVPASAPLGWKKRGLLLLAAIVLPVITWKVADLDQMSGAGNEHALELSGNGLYSLAAAMRRNELDYDRFYRTIPQAEADSILLKLDVERAPLDLKNISQAPHDRTAELGPFSGHPRNVVLISVESLSAEFLGTYGGTRNLTPQLDRIANEGLRFENVYATGTRTVRGLEALSLGTPPIPGQAILRRPNNEHLVTIGELLEHQGFKPYFIYGGYGYFDNMNAYFASNDYEVFDRTSFRKETIPFENVWGVADEALFDNALDKLERHAKDGSRFFAHIMTTSNHRPFTYPDGRIDIPSPGGRDGAVKYTDYAIGRFINIAKKKPWFKDTLFVIIADHCASVAGKTKLPVEKYRIPMIFYAPALLKPGVFSKPVSQIDVPPTLLDLLAAEGDEHFYGDSIFEHAAHPARAFISNYQELGYYKDNTLIVLGPKQAAQAFAIDPQTYAATPTAMNEQLLKEAIAYYQTGSRAFKRQALKSPDYVGGNKPRPGSAPAQPKS